MGSLLNENIALSNRMGRIVVFVLLMFCSLQHELSSQENVSTLPNFWSCGFYCGNLQVHTDKLSHFEGVKIRGLELEYSKWMLTEEARYSFGFYPKWGLSLNFVDFGHSSLGYSINGIAFLEPFLVSGDKFRISGKVGAGLAYLSNPYGSGNPLNLTNSTKVAFPLVGGVNVYYGYNDHWALKISASYRHISNGGIRQPNLGINYPVLGLTLEYATKSYCIPGLTKMDKVRRNNRTEVLAAYSLKSDLDTDEKSNVMLLGFNRCSGGSRLNVFCYSTIIEYQQVGDDDSSIDPWSVGPLAGNEFLIGKLRFGQQIGVYVLRGKKAPNSLFQIYYLRYLVANKMTVGANLKAHGRVADYMAFQIGLIL